MNAGKSTCGTVMLIAGTCFTILTVVFVAISFATDYWLDYTVKRNELSSSVLQANVSNGRYTMTRHRGLFRECYPGSEAYQFLAARNDVVDSECFVVDMDIPDTSITDLSSEYLTRIHLLRTCIAFFAVGLLLIIVTFIVGLVPISCSRRSKWAFASGFLAFLVAFFLAAAIAFFHGAEYLEKRKITDTFTTVTFYQNWESDVKLATDTDYGWSYALGWVGVGCAIITAIFYIIGGFYIGDERYEYGEYLEKGRGRSRDYIPNGYDNRAYPGDSPYGPYPPPVAYGPPGPYVQELETGRNLQQMPYWSWS